MPGTAAKVRMSEKQLAVLEELSRSRTAAKGIVQRALILVLGFQGLLNEQIAEEVGLNRQQVGVWRQRWRDEAVGASAASLEDVAEYDGEESGHLRARGGRGLPDVSRCPKQGRSPRHSHRERG